MAIEYTDYDDCTNTPDAGCETDLEDEAPVSWPLDFPSLKFLFILSPPPLGCLPGMPR